jgi:hypothetical protein
VQRDVLRRYASNASKAWGKDPKEGSLGIHSSRVLTATQKEHVSK